MMLQDKVVVVAGVGSGIGRSVALASAREGADVVLAARTAARLDDVAKEVTGLGRRGLAVPSDLSDAAAATDLRRLPEPDEIADAVVFLASPLARAITGQCLDVNCGEYHH